MRHLQFIFPLFSIVKVEAWSQSQWPTHSSSRFCRLSSTSLKSSSESDRDRSNNWDLLQSVNGLSNRRDSLKTIIGTTSTIVAGSTLQAPPALATTASNNNVFYPPPNSLNGKVILITGGTSGLGLESSKRLAAAGASIILTGRTAAKGQSAVEEVQSYLASINVQNSNVYALPLDLSSFQSINSFPKQLLSLLQNNDNFPNKSIDVLMNNAGVAAIPQREITQDGFERTFQTNHLGPFVLTSLLFPYLNRNGSRIINVSSIAHTYATTTKGKRGLDLQNLNSELQYSYQGWGAYGQTKLENILFTRELQRRANEAHLDWLTVVALHPGAVATDIWRSTYAGLDARSSINSLNKSESNMESNSSFSVQSLVSRVFYGSLLTLEEGANTQVMLASFREGDGVPVKGQYFDYDMKVKALEDFSLDEMTAKMLWDKSEELTGVQFVVE